MHLTMFEMFVGADLEHSRSLGASLGETNAFVDVAMGLRDMHTLKWVEGPPIQADVVDGGCRCVA